MATASCGRVGPARCWLSEAGRQGWESGSVCGSILDGWGLLAGEEGGASSGLGERRQEVVHPLARKPTYGRAAEGP